MESLKYVTPEYQQRLANLAELLCTKERYQAPQQLGSSALQATVEVPANIVMGVE